jgi:UDP-3-O-[3-hydroxymyristoyl] glucosamine N-acyltransferase
MITEYVLYKNKYRKHKTRERYVTAYKLNIFYRSEDYIKANISPNLPILSYSGMTHNVYVGKNTEIKFLRIISSNNEVNTIKIGNNTILENGVMCGFHVTIGNNCRIENFCEIGRSAKIRNNVTILKNAVIGEHSILYPGTLIEEETVIRPQSEVIKQVVIHEKNPYACTFYYDAHRDNYVIIGLINQLTKKNYGDKNASIRKI